MRDHAGAGDRDLDGRLPHVCRHEGVTAQLADDGEVRAEAVLAEKPREILAPASGRLV